MSDLVQTAYDLVAPGKGVLAMDESHGTCTKRFTALGVECTEATRQSYRQMIVTCPDLEQYVSGAILFDETLRQSTTDGVPFVKILEEKGILPGIKVDMGAKPLSGTLDETVTEGLDGLRDRLAEYAELGARFAKWRAVIKIGEGKPSLAALEANAHALARYAALCQEAGIVPIVEPEILMEGDHDLEVAYSVAEMTLHTVFNKLFDQNVLLEGMLLKPSMVINGVDCGSPATAQEVAEATMNCFYNTVPAAVPGIIFLSGGQTGPQAAEHLSLMNQLGEHPWAVSFSYGRAIQQPALEAWAKDQDDHAAAQKLLLHRAQCCGAASLGDYTAEME